MPVEVTFSLDRMASATFSDCARYRYELTRKWDTGEGVLVWVLLNPSTADAFKLDPTIRRCVKFSKRWGFAELVIVNLFGIRSPHPDVLPKADDPAGPDNRFHLGRWLAEGDRIMVAWGANQFAREAARSFARKAALFDIPLFCLGTNGDGSPRHPLSRGKNRVPDDFEPVPWRGR